MAPSLKMWHLSCQSQPSLIPDTGKWHKLSRVRPIGWSNCNVGRRVSQRRCPIQSEDVQQSCPVSPIYNLHTYPVLFKYSSHPQLKAPPSVGLLIGDKNSKLPPHFHYHFVYLQLIRLVTLIAHLFGNVFYFTSHFTLMNVITSFSGLFWQDTII